MDKPGSRSAGRCFEEETVAGFGGLIFGRLTYEIMESFWPTAEAADASPIVVERMNALPKYVFSRTMRSPGWRNTTVFDGELTERLRSLKRTDGAALAILGSCTIVAQAANAGLIDEYLLLVSPIALGSGRTMLEGITVPVAFEPVTVRVFGNGNVLLHYKTRSRPARWADLWRHHANDAAIAPATLCLARNIINTRGDRTCLNKSSQLSGEFRDHF